MWFLFFSLLIMSVWSIIAVGQTTAKISKHIPEIEKWIQKQFAKGKTPPFSFICDGKPSAEFIRQWDYSQQKIESEEAYCMARSTTFTCSRVGELLVPLLVKFNTHSAA